MKIYYFFVITILCSCGSKQLKHTYHNTDFVPSQQAYAQAFVPGLPNTARGVTLHFPSLVTFDYPVSAICFRQSVSTTTLYTDTSKQMMRARFNLSPDLIMDANAVNEHSNRLPSTISCPDNLANDEAVIALQPADSDALIYVKITGIIDRPDQLMPHKVNP